MTLSADEWLMSLSPHSATFSSAVTAWPLMSRARPQTRSVSSGFRLCGIEDDPFWPAAKGSSTSRISVRCSPRISVANFSRDAAMRASVETNCAWRSLWTIWFETGARQRPRRLHTLPSMDGGTEA